MLCRGQTRDAELQRMDRLDTDIEYVTQYKGAFDRPPVEMPLRWTYRLVGKHVAVLSVDEHTQM